MAERMEAQLNMQAEILIAHGKQLTEAQREHQECEERRALDRHEFEKHRSDSIRRVSLLETAIDELKKKGRR